MVNGFQVVMAWNPFNFFIIPFQLGATPNVRSFYSNRMEKE